MDGLGVLIEEIIPTRARSISEPGSSAMPYSASISRSIYGVHHEPPNRGLLVICVPGGPD